MPFADFKKGKIHYTDDGNGRAVVLLHGFLESSKMWENYLPHFVGKTRRVVCIDLPGHGESDTFGYVHDMELMAGAIKAVLKELNLRRVVLVGHSMGGYAAMAFAEFFPDNVKGICLFCSTARNDSDLRKTAREEAIKLVKQDHKSFIRKSIPLLFRPENRKIFKPEINALKKEALRMSPRAIVAALKGMKNRKDREIILRFNPYPVHFIIGKEDSVLLWSDLIAQTKHSDNVTYSLFEESGHMGFLEDERACRDDLVKFFNSLHQ